MENKDRDEKIYEEYNNGISIKELSGTYSLSTSRISQIIRRYERKKECKIIAEKREEFKNLKPCERCINKGICKYVDVETPKIEYPFTIVCQVQENIRFSDWLKEVEE